jgi:preprotein translocase subunit YajC
MLYAVALLLAQEEAPKQDGNPLSFFAPFILILVLFYFLMLRPARQREKQQRDMLMNQLKKNDEVVTSAGIIGTVANIKDDEVTLKVDESANVRLRVLKSTIVKIITPKDAAAANSDAVKAGAPPK